MIKMYKTRDKSYRYRKEMEEKCVYSREIERKSTVMSENR